jgi:hypothetical protein
MSFNFLRPRAEAEAECAAAGRHLTIFFFDGGPVKCVHCFQSLMFGEAAEQVGLPWQAIAGTTQQQYDILRGLNEEGESINDYLAKLPTRRYSHEAKGLLLLSPRTGIVFVPAMPSGQGYFTAVVVKGTETYPVGGYNLDISAREIATAIRLEVCLQCL